MRKNGGGGKFVLWGPGSEINVCEMRRGSDVGMIKIHHDLSTLFYERDD